MIDKRNGARPGHALLILSLVYTIAVTPFETYAQGLRVGVVRADIIEGGQQLDTRDGLLIGAALARIARGPFALVPEVTYVQKGARTVGLVGDDAVEDIRVDYVELNALVRLGPQLRIPVVPFVNGGLSFGWEAGCSISFRGSGERSRGCPLAGLREAGIDGPFEETDLGFIAGGGLDISFPRIGLVTVEYRLSQSLGDVIQGEADTAPKHRVHIITLGWGGLMGR